MTGLSAKLKGQVGDFALDVSFEAPKRGLTALFGPSGCGKTTVLRCLAGLAQMNDGYLKVGDQIWQDGKTFLKPHQRPVGYVFQEANLFPHLNVRQNATFGMKRAGQKDPILFDEIITLMGLENHLDRDPSTLSGGERQRVAMARALLTRPSLLLMDEPLSALDRFAKDDILPYFETLAGRLDIPIIYVTHDLGEVERLAQSMVLMDKGSIRAAGPLDDLLPDLDLPMSRTREGGVVLNAVIRNYDLTYDLTTLDLGVCHLVAPGCLGPDDRDCRIRLLAQNISLSLSAPEGSSILNVIPSRIHSCKALDKARIMVRLNLGDEGNGPAILAQITLKSWEDMGLAPGMTVFAQIKGAVLINEAPTGLKPA